DQLLLQIQGAVAEYERSVIAERFRRGKLQRGRAGRWLAGRGADEKTVLLWNAQTHAVAASFPGHEAEVRGVAFSPNGRFLASCSLDRTARVWEIDSGNCQVLRGHTDEVFAVAFHPGGTRLATAGRDRAIWLWDLAKGEEVARLPGHANYFWSLA